MKKRTQQRMRVLHPNEDETRARKGARCKRCAPSKGSFIPLCIKLKQPVASFYLRLQNAVLLQGCLVLLAASRAAEPTDAAAPWPGDVAWPRNAEENRRRAMSRGAGRPPNAAAKVPYDSKQPLLAFGRSLAMTPVHASERRERTTREHRREGGRGGCLRFIWALLSFICCWKL